MSRNDEAAVALRRALEDPIYNKTLRKEVGRGELDYEVYLRTRELLALQTPRERAGRPRRAAVPGDAPDAGAVAQVRGLRGRRTSIEHLDGDVAFSALARSTAWS